MVTFARTTADPLSGAICVLAGLLFYAVKAALGRKPPHPASLPSFRFSEGKGALDEPFRIIHTKVRGVSYRNPNGVSRQQIIRKSCRAGDALLLAREPSNPADPNAVAVIRICRGAEGKTTFGELLGHLSTEIAQDLAVVFPDEGPVGIAEVLEVTGDLDSHYGGSVGVNIRAEILMPDDGTKRPSQLPLFTRPSGNA